MAAISIHAQSSNAPAAPKFKDIVIDGVEGFQDTPMQPDGKWHVHDPARPQPPVVTPGASFSQNAAPPSDAIVLFDGKDLSQWRDKDNGGPALWTVEDGVMVSAKGDIQTTNNLATSSCIWNSASRRRRRASGQGRGNSGVFFMGLYEIQVLDCYDQQNLCRRSDRRTLRPASGARQRLPSARRMADLRHRFQRAAF